MSSLEENVSKMGRIACVALDNALDSILTGEAKLLMPLNNGTTGEPIVYPSKHFIDYIMKLETNEQSLALLSTSAGKFRVANV